MFECSHCHTRFGGIRGIAADKCPRCATGDSASALLRSLSAVPATRATLHPLQEAVSRFTLPGVPSAIR
jgi:hypothetical protein